MRAFVDAKVFSTALSQVEKVLQKSSIPALEGILVHFSGDSCSLTGTDLTTWLRKKLPARGDDFSFVIRKPGIALKACRYFDGELTLELAERCTRKWCCPAAGVPESLTRFRQKNILDCPIRERVFLFRPMPPAC